ncbi:MAG: primosomal protein [Micrococcales bacterium]|uniref:primosomal protein n=1 Tax=Phycicoccus sp. TaxID=1902410 RepID=UPI0019865346|nr:primosomal protein [Phycicoccus sp.]MBD3783728.1 primosomal protein [Micrococcales bacterium]HMM94405.1 primosomal protein [Phycicoccus sp.]
MTADPRAALARLVSAFERHLEAASTRRGDDDPTVIAAYEDLADAFEEYDGALYDAYGEMTPLDLYTGDDDDDEEPVDDHDDEDGDRARIYSGLDDDFDEDDEDD